MHAFSGNYEYVVRVVALCVCDIFIQSQNFKVMAVK